MNKITRKLTKKKDKIISAIIVVALLVGILFGVWAASIGYAAVGFGVGFMVMTFICMISYPFYKVILTKIAKKELTSEAEQQIQIRKINSDLKVRQIEKDNGTLFVFDLVFDERPDDYTEANIKVMEASLNKAISSVEDIVVECKICKYCNH